MNSILPALIAAALLAGCSIHPSKQITAARAAGVGPVTLSHLKENRPLTPSDLIDLKHAGVADEIAVTHLERIGVDYEPTKDDHSRLKAAGVGPHVRDAFSQAASRYVNWMRNGPRAVVVHEPFFYDPWWGWGPSFHYVHVHRRCR